MPREFARADRLGRQIRRDLAGLLQRETADPRFASVTVSEVEVARDLACAKVHVQTPAGDDHEATLHALRGAARYLRTRLAGRLRVRNVPELRFEYDRSPEAGSRIERLLSAGPEGLDGP